MRGTSRRRGIEGSAGGRDAALLLVLVAGATAWSAAALAPAARPAEAGEQTQHQTTGQALPPLLPPSSSADLPTPLTAKQKKALLKGNFEQMKREADELAQLAKSLQEDLDKSNQNVLSLQVVDKAGQIEKLAKKIRSAATAY